MISGVLITLVAMEGREVFLGCSKGDAAPRTKVSKFNVSTNVSNVQATDILVIYVGNWWGILRVSKGGNCAYEQVR